MSESLLLQSSMTASKSELAGLSKAKSDGKVKSDPSMTNNNPSMWQSSKRHSSKRHSSRTVDRHRHELVQVLGNTVDFGASCNLHCCCYETGLSTDSSRQIVAGERDFCPIIAREMEALASLCDVACLW